MADLDFKSGRWFFEESTAFDTLDAETGIKIKKKLYSGKSDYQKIDVYDSYGFKRFLALDGILQIAEADEFIYHEMLCQTAMFLHKNPKQVLIIGGGDGGSLREVLKHNIDKVYMVEIDKKVIEISKKYLPGISKGSFENKKAEVIIADGKEFIKKYNNYFDVIILDLSDPEGPAEDLFSVNFYKDIKKALKVDGIVSVQSESFTYQPNLVKTISKRIRKVFPYAETRHAIIPSYQAGEYCFTIGAKVNLGKVSLKDIDKKYKKLKLDLKYYYPEVHFASKVLPKYLLPLCQ